MPQRLSEDVSRVIVQALQRGHSRSQISGVVGVSKRAITRINTNLKKHGSPKAPPSGVKLGRPTKMSREHAEAMLAWMAERDYTFYVKDLVVYLRENFNYVGCDGTVRRGLIKAGFKRKLPWHKSEVSVWVPPEVPYLPEKSSSTKDANQLTQESLENEMDPELNNSTVQNQEIVSSSHLSNDYSFQIPSQPTTSHPDMHQLLSSSTHPLSQITIGPSPDHFSQHAPDPAPGQIQHQPRDLTTLTPNPMAPKHRGQSTKASSKEPSRIAKTTVASKSQTSKSKAVQASRQLAATAMTRTPSDETNPADESGEEPSDFITQLQRQLLDQKEEIRRLHLQLQAHQSEPLPHQFLDSTPLHHVQRGAREIDRERRRDYRSPYLDEVVEV